MSIFSGGKDIKNAINESSDIYKQQMQQINDLYDKRYGQGRGDITQGYGEAIGYQQPYMQAGQQGLDEYMRSMGLSGGAGTQSAVDRFRTSPGYQFAVKQGMQNAQRGMAAAGMVGSGAEMAALQQQAQGMADQEFGGYQQKLGALAGMGQQASTMSSQLAAGRGGALSNLGFEYTQGQGGIMSQMAQSEAEARMAAGLAQAQNKSNMLGSIGSLAGMGTYGYFNRK